MKIACEVFEHEEDIPSKYTCDGENISPPLKFFDIPEETQTLALIVDDPDAPNGTFVHWVVWNISPNTLEIAEGGVPEEAVEGANSFGQTAYGGPCPPDGQHRYFFKLYALNTTLDLRPDADKDDLLAAIEDHIIEETELIGLYVRQ